MTRLRLLACTVLLALSSVPAWADLSRDDAAAAAQRASNGRVLAVERADGGGRPAWRVKVLTAGGEVRVLLVDAVTGRVQ
ncbi:PepSY domain-containing protein [Ramlibacter sp.]|uniref:PepSY domain-containing protein n=1 Tax=Ramlibacter sp. TaxID=1917967 RepID=UPI0017AE1E34|nr:PepSY domain-containing protein [Ramlibacter sp.]MBA2676004.1 PepSY domain-containing protein [Ramlibacter sp.]